MEDPPKTEQNSQVRGDLILCVLYCGVVRPTVETEFDCPPRSTTYVNASVNCVSNDEQTKYRNAYYDLCCASAESGVLIECQPSESIPILLSCSWWIMGSSSSSLPRCLYQRMSTARERIQNNTSCISSEDGTRLSMSSPSVYLSKTELSRKSQLSLFFSDHDFLLDSPCVSPQRLSSPVNESRTEEGF